MKSIKNLSDDFKGMGTGGYLVVPRNLLGRVLDTGTPFTPAQAYMYLYVRCEFCNRKGKEALKRGADDLHLGRTGRPLHVVEACGEGLPAYAARPGRARDGGGAGREVEADDVFL